MHVSPSPSHLETSRALPRLVSDYLARAVPHSRVLPGQIELTQEGLMWSKPGAGARRFTATQHSAVDRVAFEWRARFRIARVLSLDVVDSFCGGEGSLDVRICGRRFQHDAGPETSSGEALRYLAELPWAPHAMYGNRALRWRAVDAAHVEVHIEPDPSLKVTFEFDDHGDIVRAFSASRALRRKGHWLQMPWEGTFCDYRTLGGMRLPTVAEVAWDLPEGRFVYWRGRVLAARALSSPFARAR